MLTFTEFLIKEMAARSRPRAQKLLNFIAKRQRAYTRPRSSTPQVSTDTQIATILPHVPSWKLPRFVHSETGKKVDTYLHASKNGTIKRVPLKDVITTQETVQKEVVAKKVQGKWKGHYPEHPHGVIVHAPGHELHNKIILSDGNHRANSSKLQGKEHMVMKLGTVHIHPDDMLVHKINKMYPGLNKKDE